MDDTVTYNLEQRVMVDFDGHTYPITKMFDDEGRETDEADECVAFIAGREGYWVAVAIRENGTWLTDDADDGVI